MFKKLIATTGTAAALAFSAGASAAFINGSVSFSNGLDAESNIVSDLTLFEIGTPTNANGGTGDLTPVTGVTAASDIDLTDPTGNNPLYVNNGFIFTLSSISNVVSSGLSCNGGLCSDNIGFTIQGTVSAPGFDETAFTGQFTANGTCVDAGGGVCTAGSESGSWSSSVVALGREVVPTPGTLALFGIALAAAGLVRRKIAA